MLKIYCDGCNAFIKDYNVNMDIKPFIHNAYCDVCKVKVDAFREWCFKAERQSEIQLKAAIEAKRKQVFGGV